MWDKDMGFDMPRGTQRWPSDLFSHQARCPTGRSSRGGSVELGEEDGDGRMCLQAAAEGCRVQLEPLEKEPRAGSALVQRAEVESMGVEGAVKFR